MTVNNNNNIFSLSYNGVEICIIVMKNKQLQYFKIIWLEEEDKREKNIIFILGGGMIYTFQL